jgi:ACS family tartrate transporter-like MFS transporter
MTPTEMPAAIPETERATLRRITWRILPFLTVAYLVAFDDRVNAGFAAL